MAVVRVILVAFLCFAAVTVASVTAASPSDIIHGNWTAFTGSGLRSPRRALTKVPWKFVNPATALGAAAGAMAKAVQSAAAKIASSIFRAPPGGQLVSDNEKANSGSDVIKHECDFYIDLGLPSLPVPVVSQVTLRSQDHGDGPVSLNIATSVPPVAGEIGKLTKGYQVEVDATGKAKYSKCKAADLAKTVSYAGEQFYVTGEPARVYARTFQNDLPVEAFQGCLVRLPLDSVQLKAPDGHVINLNKGDGDSSFPQGRRCLLFKVLAF